MTFAAVYMCVGEAYRRFEEAIKTTPEQKAQSRAHAPASTPSEGGKESTGGEQTTTTATSPGHKRAGQAGQTERQRFGRQAASQPTPTHPTPKARGLQSGEEGYAEEKRGRAHHITAAFALATAAATAGLPRTGTGRPTHEAAAGTSGRLAQTATQATAPTKPCQANCPP